MAIQRNFTRPAIEKLSVGVYQDQKQPFLFLQAYKSGTKTFYFYKSVDGRPLRITIGKFPGYTPDAARKICAEYLTSLAMGVNPKEAKKVSLAEAQGEEYRKLTVADVMEDYLLKPLSDKTKYQYKATLRHGLHALADTKMIELTVPKIRAAMMDIESIGVRTNSTRLLISLLNFAKLNYRADGEVVFNNNPASDAAKIYGLKANMPRRTGRLLVEQFPEWWEWTMMQTLERRVYFRMVCLTGTRRTEMGLLSWDEVDFYNEWISIDKAKTKSKNRPNVKNHEIPMTSMMMEELKLLHHGEERGHVFPSLVRHEGDIKQPPQMPFVSLHDLRRTFLSTAEQIGVPLVQMKMLVHHTTAGDTTMGYVIPDRASLRHSMERIHAQYLRYIEGEEKIIDFPLSLKK